ncbi:FAD-binding oxidoreductase [Aquamicrobium lusatiense]|uniref:NAD(P)/FAD-dependent oxidoreductase n=1 Tax=Aquamicrobium lusatiense TaxID=89772 RepID=UPI002456CE06|nr:FAD-binding oxidoreductase [Aquamicrobium lusatiense]MDH4989403.1 FAD-binding oxidoreductase [Aquamicrobium lusatiense]
MTTGSGRTGTIGVVGGGYVGVCTALQLARAGHDVVLIDIGQPEKAASYGNSGQFAVGEVVPLAVPGILRSVPGWLLDPLGPLTIRWRDLPMLTPWLARFVLASRTSKVEIGSRAMASLCDRMHADYAPLLDAANARSIISDTDCIKLYRSRADWEAESKTWRLRERAGLQFELLDRAAIERLEPEMTEFSQFGVMLKGRTYIRNPLRMLQTLTKTFEEMGGKVVTGEVTGFDKRDRRVHAVTLASGESLELDSVVLTAGIGSRKLSRQLGDKLPLISERGYHLMLPNPGVRVNRSYTLGWAGMGIVPMEQGLRLAGTVELASSDAPPNFARAHNLLVHAKKLFPGLESEGVKQWMGHRPSFPDSLPVIDRASRFDNVIYAFGHGHMGVGWAATTGKMVTALQEGRPSEVDIRPFSLKRFG